MQVGERHEEELKEREREREEREREREGQGREKCAQEPPRATHKEVRVVDYYKP